MSLLVAFGEVSHDSTYNFPLLLQQKTGRLWEIIETNEKRDW